MADKMVNFIPGTGQPLTFDVAGWAVANFASPSQPAPANCFFTSTWRDILLGVVGTGVVSVYGSTQEDPVDFTLPSAPGNLYVPIVLADYSLANTYTNGTVTVVGGSKIVELNTNLLTWIGIQRSANTVDVICTITNAQ